MSDSFRAPQPPHATSAAPLLAIRSEHRLRAENLAFDIDVWYPLLAAHTFASVFLPLTRREARAILNFQHSSFLERPRLTTSDVVVLRGLEARLDAALPGPSFVRLCGRSPKDGEPLSRGLVQQQYAAALSRLRAEDEDNDGVAVPRLAADLSESESFDFEGNVQLRAIARVQWLKVSSGAEAMSLLLSSERVFADLDDWLRWGEPEQIVLRAWEPDLSLEFEFRAFVYGNQLTAISQYDHYTVHPGLIPLKSRIQEKILALWNEVHPCIRMSEYVIDFAYLPGTSRCVVIELSPFLPCTGAALFHWTRDADVLLHGPLQFRLTTAVHPQTRELVQANWTARWETEVPRYSDLYKLAQPCVAAPPLTPAVGQQLLLLCCLLLWAFGPGVLLLAVAAAVGLALCPSSTSHLLFVYGTLKRGFHWHSKYLSRAEFVGSATTVPALPLVIGDCGVPYLLGDCAPGTGKQVLGEVWLVSSEVLAGLDDYEGISKGYYCRRAIPVAITATTNTEKREGCDAFWRPAARLLRGLLRLAPCSSTPGGPLAFAYFKSKSDAALRQGPFLDEYSLEAHQALYNPIRHILAKQDRYLGREGADERD